MTVHPQVLSAMPVPFMAVARAIEVAMSGGAAQGAFAWGVLDRLLEDARISIAEVDASGAGAANAAVLAYELTVGGRQGARRALQAFWRRAARSGAFVPAWGALAQKPPGPPNASPLQWALEQVVDFDRLRRGSVLPLFLSAVNLRTGRIRVFAGRGICLKAVLAAASLPLLAHAVTIDGEPYAAHAGGEPTLLRERGDKAGIRIAIQRDPDLAVGLLGDGFDLGAVHIGTRQERDADWELLQELHSIGRDRADAWLATVLARPSARPRLRTEFA